MFSTMMQTSTACRVAHAAPDRMTNEGNRYFGRDLVYFRDVQYRDSSKLTALANLHARYGTASTPWFSWIVQQSRLAPGRGCARGRMWSGLALGAGVARRVGGSGAHSDRSLGGDGQAKRSIGCVRASVRSTARWVNVQSLPFADDSFDVVVVYDMLYHVPFRRWPSQSATAAP